MQLHSFCLVGIIFRYLFVHKKWNKIIIQSLKAICIYFYKFFSFYFYPQYKRTKLLVTIEKNRNPRDISHLSICVYPSIFIICKVCLHLHVAQTNVISNNRMEILFFWLFFSRFMIISFNFTYVLHHLISIYFTPVNVWFTTQNMITIIVALKRS